LDLSPKLTKKTILLVDDSISIRHTIKASLRAQGFSNFLEAPDGDKALKTTKLKQVDLIVCDWMMPNMSGLELFSALKAEEKTKNTPFILLTGNDQKENVTEAVKAGIKHYVVKPFNPYKLFEKIVELLEQQDKTKEDSSN
jgi:two-component system, chemotaxis family, chemotaxis protein CheY